MSFNLLLLCFLTLLTLGPAVFGTGRSTSRTLFNEAWLFQKDDPLGTESFWANVNIAQITTVTGNEFLLTTRDFKPAVHDTEFAANISYTQPAFDDSTWRQLRLPHDWAIEGDARQELPTDSAKRPTGGPAWYRKHFDVPASNQAKQVYIDFDGAMSHSAVWLNGKFVGGWPFGYASFRLDLTPYVEFGNENVIAVRVDNPPDSSRWYSGAGIYRNVWLVVSSPVHVDQWGTFITTPTVGKGSSRVKAEIKVKNSSDKTETALIETSIYRSSNGQRSPAPAVSLPPQMITIPARGTALAEGEVWIAGPDLWTPDTPNLYVAATNVIKDGEIVDTYETDFGIRSFRFDPNAGLFVNEQPIEIRGVCQHDDMGALGMALNTRALERQFEILKEMGVNAIRMSHNPHAPEFLDLADHMGIMLIDEAFDAWERPKRSNDYSTLFANWHEKDLRALIRRDRNHPSVILWSIGNEILDQGTRERKAISVVPVSSALAQIVREEDPTRPTNAAANTIEGGYDGFQKTLDVFGYNYKPDQYGPFHRVNPTIPLLATESSATISSRGEYFFPVPRARELPKWTSEEILAEGLAVILNDGGINNDLSTRGTTVMPLSRSFFSPVLVDVSKGYSNFQVSSYDLYRQDWATLPETEFAAQDRNPFVAGEFVWSGFDYLGEINPYEGPGATLSTFTDPVMEAKVAADIRAYNKINVPQRSSYFGILDLCGFKKDRFYLYQARWRPDLPMAHILPHWNWPERIGEITPVHVYTSGDEGELFLNGKSLGRKKRAAFIYRLRWDDVVYEPGELKVITYKNGAQWATAIVRTTGPPAGLTMSADRSEIMADGSDLAFITVTVADSEGSTVPRSKERIKYEISGPGEIAGVDNGDPTDLESFQSTDRKAFNGMALVIIRSLKGKTGPIELKATSGSLKSAKVALRAVSDQ